MVALHLLGIGHRIRTESTIDPFLTFEMLSQGKTIAGSGVGPCQH